MGDKKNLLENFFFRLNSVWSCVEVEWGPAVRMSAKKMKKRREEECVCSPCIYTTRDRNLQSWRVWVALLSLILSTSLPPSSLHPSLPSHPPLSSSLPFPIYCPPFPSVTAQHLPGEISWTLFIGKLSDGKREIGEICVNLLRVLVYGGKPNSSPRTVSGSSYTQTTRTEAQRPRCNFTHTPSIIRFV